MDKSEALQLAEAMSFAFPGNLGIDKAAAELRRLAAVEAQRDALLEALKVVEPLLAPEVRKKARAVIKAVEETK